MQRLHLRIEGRVQGVGFRQFVRRLARGLGLRGWVRNLPDGGVEVVAEGSETALQSLLEGCRRGPSGSKVEAVDSHRSPATGEFSGFEITYF